MDIICSYCKVTIGHREPLTDHSGTHGVCKRCMERVMNDIDIMHKNRKRGIKQWWKIMAPNN